MINSEETAAMSEQAANNSEQTANRRSRTMSWADVTLQDKLAFFNLWFRPANYFQKDL